MSIPVILTLEIPRDRVSALRLIVDEWIDNEREHTGPLGDTSQIKQAELIRDYLKQRLLDTAPWNTPAEDEEWVDE